MAPSYIAAIVGILSAVLPMLGVDIAPESLTTTITVLSLVVVAVRQLITGRSTLGGTRPK